MAVNLELSQKVIAQNELIQEKDKKYIEFLEKFYLRSEKIQAEIRDKDAEIFKLRERIEQLEKIPLVNIEDNSVHIVQDEEDLIDFNENEDPQHVDFLA